MSAHFISKNAASCVPWPSMIVTYPSMVGEVVVGIEHVGKRDDRRHGPGNRRADPDVADLAQLARLDPREVDPVAHALPGRRVVELQLHRYILVRAVDVRVADTQVGPQRPGNRRHGLGVAQRRDQGRVRGLEEERRVVGKTRRSPELGSLSTIRLYVRPVTDPSQPLAVSRLSKVTSSVPIVPCTAPVCEDSLGVEELDEIVLVEAIQPVEGDGPDGCPVEASRRRTGGRDARVGELVRARSPRFCSCCC